MQPVLQANWLDEPSNLQHYLSEKNRLLAQRRDDVFVAEIGSEESQREVLELVRSYLSLSGKAVLSPTEMVEGEPALVQVSRLVADDFVLMRRGEEGWYLSAACVCFPSSWNLREKFGRPMGAIHGPVPDFQSGTRHAQMIERIFDRLAPEQLLLRLNWSLYRDDDLFHPVGHVGAAAINEQAFIADPYVRTERQTVRKLARSGDVLFAIGIQARRMSDLPQTRETKAGLHKLTDNLVALTAEQCAYKGLTDVRDELVASVRAYATDL